MKCRTYHLSLLLLCVILQIMACATASQETSSHRRVLKIVLYPFIPAKDAFVYATEQEFEKTYPQIDLQVIDLSSNYYDTTKPYAITNTEADVLEVDSVLLGDLAQDGRIQPLPRRLIPAKGQYLNVAELASTFEGIRYGVPHWVCTNFLFFRKGDALGDATSFLNIERLLGTNHPSGHGLLIDMKGKSTIGELYLDALLDHYGSMADAARYLTKDNISTDAEGVLKSAITLCDPDYCRDEDYHDAVGFYARRFARKDGRALAGYSERLYYVIDERLNSCKKGQGECINHDEIDYIELPLSTKGSHPFAWVDTLTISKTCTGQCVEDAAAFIAFYTSVEQVKQSLRAPWHSAPRYLLPAHVALYTDADLKNDAPLYSRMQASLQRAIAVTGYHLNANLRDIGKELDKRLSK